VLEHLGPISEGIAATVGITLAAFAVGSVIGLPLAAGTRSRWVLVRIVVRFYVDLVRAIPPIVWLFIIFYGLAQDAVKLEPYPAAVLGLGMVSGAYMSEVYRGGLLAVRPGQWEAARALGLGRLQMMRSVIAPQAFFVVLPGAAAWAVALLKETAVVSVIGVSDITFRAASETQRTADGLNIFILAGVIYIALSVPLAGLARWTDARVSRAVAR
jgi:His/Glu/Gln/Arg/opine family amino acid ABC transporter permease subunit